MESGRQRLNTDDVVKACEEDKQQVSNSILSEDEIRDVMSLYNTSVDQCTQENDRLKNEINRLLGQLRLEEQQTYMIEQEINEIQRQTVTHESMLEREMFEIRLLEAIKSDKREKSGDIDQQIERLKKEQKRLRELKEQNFTDVDLEPVPLPILKTCQNCKFEFSLDKMSKNACIFHPGKIKYFSCKGCGDDEYYTCC